jgi:hypothetical protein
LEGKKQTREKKKGMAEQKKVRVSICRNGNMQDIKVRAVTTRLGNSLTDEEKQQIPMQVGLITPNDWKELLKVSSNKFRFKAKRVFSSINGSEITENDFQNATQAVKVSFFFFLLAFSLFSSFFFSFLLVSSRTSWPIPRLRL